MTKILVHVTFSTKQRVPLLAESLEPSLYAYVGEICRGMDSALLAMGGTSDHVHMLISLGKTTNISDLMLHVKRDSSKWVKEQDASLNHFAWQDGYLAFSIGESGADALRAYIARQKEHHQTTDYKEEMRVFFSKYGIEWNESHVWD